MTVIHYILRDGTDRAVDAKDGASLMENAIMNNVRGIEAECGGCCSCATCHVYVDEKFAALLPAPDEMENELLDGVAAERKPTSRLSCQISVGPELDGLIVHIPEAQY
ncbi:MULTISPECIES: 2Fe-2S iron-sulfur cluster-binding protein [Pusillimonas]|uniref:2Fe-2S iron-sulfur cluster binding domain-containing protein n=1 Tax=Pusillimonas minor TaxID=2697024 RepID=A0A842HQH0_9BURK|nr:MULTISPECIES: 2Fe-2S iron-sulfur cluster-binding protein [Pusillimonas]MBC2770084.1 2Fe-2S iron-sulfur cluster binding domain-containing protein [Pusillimonas minor]ROT46624.1 ferredoxin [Pusillimonas sp. NJUB218]